MDEVVESDEPTASQLPLWIVVTSGRRTSTFELDGEKRRVIVIGSSRDSEFCIVDARLAPIECFLEREGDEIWLVPGDPSAELRVDTVLVVRPTRLWRRCVIDVGSITFSVRIREEPPTSPDHEIPTKRGTAGSPITDGTAEIATIPTLVPWALPNPWADSAFPLPVSAMASDEQISIRSIVAIEPPPTPVGCSPMPLAACGPDEMLANGQGFTPQAIASGPPSKRLESLEAPPSSTSPAVASHRGPPSVPSLHLEQLGVFAIQRPWLVLSGVISGAMVLASAMHFGTQAVMALSSVAQEARNPIPEYPKLAGSCPDDTSAPRAATSDEPMERRVRCQRLPSVRPPAILGLRASTQATPIPIVFVADH